MNIKILVDLVVSFRVYFHAMVYIFRKFYILADLSQVVI